MPPLAAWREGTQVGPSGHPEMWTLRIRGDQCTQSLQDGEAERSEQHSGTYRVSLSVQQRAGQEIQFLIKNLPTRITLALGGCTGGFYQTVKEELAEIPQKRVHKLEKNYSQVILWDQHYPDTKIR